MEKSRSGVYAAVTVGRSYRSTFRRDIERCCNGLTLLSNGRINVHPSLHKLIVSLSTATVSDEWKLDKQQTSHYDILDSFRLALCNYELPKEQSLIILS